MTKTLHTPTPWKAVTDLRGINGSLMGYVSIQPAYEPGSDQSHLRMADGSHHVCRFSHSYDGCIVAKRKADADFIVRAVNSHDALVALLTEARARLGETYDPEDDALHDLRDRIDAALAEGRASLPAT